MKKLRWQLSASFQLIVVLSISCLSAGDAHSGPYPTLQDHYQGPYGFFTHWSAVAEPIEGARPSIAYSVCNVDRKQALYFHWDKPGFGSGWTYPLPIGSCATLTRSAGVVKFDDKTIINFTAHNEKWEAKAYLPEERSLLPQSTLSRLLGFFRREDTNPRVVDVSVRVLVGENKRVTYILGWPQGVAGLAVGFDLNNVAEETRQQIIANLASAGHEVRYARAPEFVDSSDRERLTGPTAEATYLLIKPKVAGPFGANLSYDAIYVNPVSAPMLVIDEQQRIVAVGSYGTVR
jgi:hypothetical protein